MQDFSTKSQAVVYSQRIAKFAVKHRKLLLGLSCILTLLLASGILRSSFDTSLSALLSQSDPYVAELERLDQEFPSSLVVNFAFIAAEQDSIFTEQVLGAIAQLRSNYTDIPLASRLSSVLDYSSPETQQPLFSKPLADYSQNELDDVAEIALADRLLSSMLLSSDASLSFAIVTVDSDEASAEQRIDIANATLQLRDELRRDHPNVGIHVNSEVLFEQSSQEAMLSDLTSLMPLIIIACVIAICYCFRSAKLGICIFTHTIFTALCTVGSLGFLGFAFNSISIIAPLVVVIISVANSVHIISIYKQSLHSGKSKLEAMDDSLAYNFRPVTLAALTTAIGFSSLNMCSSPAIQDFGQIVAIGILFAYLLTLSLLPALLIMFSRPPTSEELARAPFLHDSLEKLCKFVERRDSKIFWTCTTLAVVTILLLPLNETDFDRLDFVASDSDLKLYYDEVSSRMNRGTSLIYGVDTASIDASIEPELLQRIEIFSEWLQQQDDIESVSSLVDVLKTVNQVQHLNNPDYYRLADDADIIASQLQLYGFAQSEDFSLNRFINQDSSIMNLFVNATPMSNQQLIDLDQRISQQFADDFPDMKLIHGSGILLFARMDELVTIELMQGYSVSLILITLSLIIGLRSVYYGVLSVIPNLLPATIVFGSWGLLIGQLDPFVMMLFSISIGLVVDDTVHILSHYLDERSNGTDQSSAINHAIKTAGPALAITTLVLALGTTFLIAADTLYFQQAAKLLVPIVVIALVLDLLYLPTILRRFNQKTA